MATANLANDYSYAEYPTAPTDEYGEIDYGAEAGAGAGEGAAGATPAPGGGEAAKPNQCSGIKPVDMATADGAALEYDTFISDSIEIAHNTADSN